tara:strand:- start:1936 stop:2814 length:879 start_codon:yes stop_codon:yes gene_type:complete
LEKKPNIGIIGNGFVGSAIAHGFSLWAKVRIYDKNQKISTHSIRDVVEKSEIIFVCVPTPMDVSNKNKIDLTILDSVMKEIYNYNDNYAQNSGVVVIKSTVTPGTTKKYENLYPSMRIVFNPEFLSERTAKLDFNNPSRIILGGNWKAIEPVEKLYRNRFPHVPIIHTDSESAEFTKYACNCFYAAKISIMNEFYQVASKQNLDWNAIVGGMLTSGWINPMHTLVPGTDGNYGFGGKCFPKDINAFINYFTDCGVQPEMMTAAWKKNIEVRENKNWLNIEGAVSNNKGEQNE